MCYMLDNVRISQNLNDETYELNEDLKDRDLKDRFLKIDLKYRFNPKIPKDRYKIQI